jgi:hypothetical protein
MGGRVSSKVAPALGPEPEAPGLAAAAESGKALEISGRLVRTARLTDEWFEDLEDPASVVEELKRSRVAADLFTFCQRLPYTEPRHAYAMEWESIAVLPVTTYEHWWNTQINNKTRNLVVKAKKKGVTVRPAIFDDEFVRGITSIFNETPIRQERPFLHFGKSFETVKRQFSRYLHRENILGAYLDDELIGFVMLADAGRFASMTQVISMVRHRDKSPNNALIAKTVEMCAERGVPYLVYALWPRGPLREFKRHNGFEPVNLPRFYVPLNLRGRIALSFKLHRSPVERLPEGAIQRGRAIRSWFYARQYRSALTAPATGAAEGAGKTTGSTGKTTGSKGTAR